MRFPAYIDLVDTIDPTGQNTYLLSLRVGQDYQVPFQFLHPDGTTPEDLTGKTYKLVIGTSKDNRVGQLVFSGTSSDSLGVGGIASISAPTPANGIVQISLSAAQTAKLPTDQSPLYYTVLNTQGGAKEAMVEGQIALILGLGA